MVDIVVLPKLVKVEGKSKSPVSPSKVFQLVRKTVDWFVPVSPRLSDLTLNWADATVLDSPDKSNAKIQNADLIFTLDFNDLSRAGEMCEKIKSANGIKIMIDHHENPKNYASIILSEPKTSSTCEIVFNLINYINSNGFNSDIASCLYAGIMTDTGSFRYPSTTSKTHQIISDLIKKGANGSEIHESIYDTFSYNRLKLLGIALKNIEKINPLPYVIITLNQKELDDCRYKKGDTEGFVNYGLNIKGISLSIILIENKSENIVKMSFRSKGSFSVNIFAEKYFNGGGHNNAAGGISKDSLVKTKKRLIKLLKSKNWKLSFYFILFYLVVLQDVKILNQENLSTKMFQAFWRNLP